MVLEYSCCHISGVCWDTLSKDSARSRESESFHNYILSDEIEINQVYISGCHFKVRLHSSMLVVMNVMIMDAQHKVGTHG